VRPHQATPIAVPVQADIRFSLRFKLVGLITLAVLTTGVLIVAQDFRRASQSLEAELQKRAQLTAANLADAARPLLVAGSSALTDLCASFADKSDVAYVLITAPDGTILSRVLRDKEQADEAFTQRRASTVARELERTPASKSEVLRSVRGTELYAAAAPVTVQQASEGSGAETLFGLGDAATGKHDKGAPGHPAPAREARLEAVVEVGLSLAGVERVERDLLISDLGIVAVVALLGLLVASIIAGLVVRPLNQVSAAAGAVAAGDFDVQLPARARGDELNQLSRFFNHMTRELVQQRARLTSLTGELTKQRDHERGLRDLAMVINAAQSIGALVDGLFERVTTVARIDGGVFYNFDEETEQLVPVGAHRIDLGKVRPLVLGEGLVGQAGKQRALLTADSVPATRAIRVLDEDAAARSVVALPIVFQERLLAVIELATFREFSPEHLEFFRALAEQSAVALNNFYTRDAVRLARELAAKQVELENQNFELNRLNEEIQRANQHKSIFLANMSHELRTPLNAIIGFTRLVLKKAGSLLPPLQHDNLVKVEKSAGHLLTIINDILDIAKVEAGQLDLLPEPFGLDELVEEILAASTPLVGDKPLKLGKRLPADLPELDTDRGRLRQILVNLVANAVKFTSAGSVLVEAEHVAAGDRVRISVVDTGIGIAEAEQARVFDAFRQVDNSTTRKVGGTGLGLTIVKKLTELLGGAVQLESKVAVGSRFVIEVPRTLARVKGDASSGGGSPGSGTGERPPVSPAAPRAIPVLEASSAGDHVVVIEDNPDDALLLGELFGELGFTVQIAHTGAEGLALVRTLKPRLVTLDIMMPDLDGWQVLDAIKANPETRATPVIVVSIVAGEAQALGRSHGASGFIEKPISAQALREAMSKEFQ
jgi:signal transduction histidine kinase/CheY-like chemotaxis protein